MVLVFDKISAIFRTIFLKFVMIFVVFSDYWKYYGISIVSEIHKNISNSSVAYLKYLGVSLH